jgi:branched-chain amino acid transport system substrate-binding protein
MKTSLILLLLLFPCLSGCNTVDDPAELRAMIADENKGRIQVGVTFSFSSSGILFREGIEMAQDELNGAGGIKTGSRRHTLELFFKDDHRSINDGRRVAQEFAEGQIFPEQRDEHTAVLVEPDSVNIVAVIGNLSSFISIPVSTIYNYYGILMLSPGATSPKFTKQGYNLVFRSIVQDREIGKQMADFAKEQGCTKIMVASSRSSYGRGLANEFEKRAQVIGLEIVDRRSFESIGEKVNFRNELNLWKYREFDAVFLAGAHPEVTMLTKQMREVGLKQPVFGGDGLDVSKFLKLGGHDVIGAVAPSPFHYNLGLAEDGPEKTKKFVVSFKERYGKFPDTWAAQGYDAAMLLASAIVKAGSSNPKLIAQALRSMEWLGVTGLHKFDEKGDVDKPLIKKIARYDAESGQVKYEIFREGDRWLDSRKSLPAPE